MWLALSEGKGHAASGAGRGGRRGRLPRAARKARAPSCRRQRVRVVSVVGAPR